MTSHSKPVHRLVMVALAVLALGVTCALAQEMSDEAAAGMAIGILVVWALAMLVGLAVSIFVAIWLYKQAEAAGKPGAGWAVFGFLLPIPAIIVWLIVKPK